MHGIDHGGDLLDRNLLSNDQASRKRIGRGNDNSARDGIDEDRCPRDASEEALGV